MHKDLYMLAHPSLHLDSCITPPCHCCRAGLPHMRTRRMLREPMLRSVSYKDTPCPCCRSLLTTHQHLCMLLSR